MFRVAMAERGHPIRDESESDTPNDPSMVRLPYSFTMCMMLWRQFRDHGTMPVSGGLLEQPRAWLRMVQYFDARYGMAQQDAGEQSPAVGNGGGEEGESYWRSLAASERGGLSGMGDLFD